MTLFELLFFAVGIALSISFGKFSYGKIGWWGIPPAPILGFGSVWGMILLLNWIFPPRASRDLKQVMRVCGTKECDASSDQKEEVRNAH
jgi:hypothetical protein